MLSDGDDDFNRTFIFRAILSCIFIDLAEVSAVF